jgi:hypothetical protein
MFGVMSDSVDVPYLNAFCNTYKAATSIKMVHFQSIWEDYKKVNTNPDIALTWAKGV